MQKQVLEPWFFLDSGPTTVAPCLPLKGRFALGSFFIFLVCVIWTVSSVTTQYLYSSERFDSAFLMTYLGASLFAFLIPLKAWTDYVGYTTDPCCLAAMDSYDEEEEEEAYPTKFTNMEEDDVRTVTPIPQRKKKEDRYWGHMRHMHAALQIAPVMFIANYAFNAALASTTVASSTVLVSTSNVFVFVMAVLVKDEEFSCFKLFGVVLGMLGTLLTALHDFHHHNPEDEGYGNDAAACANGCDFVLWGDVLALVAAVAYGGYAVQVRVLCPQNEDLYSMQLLLGYIGIVIMFPLFPFAIYSWSENGMTGSVFTLIMIKGLMDFVISEYLHFRAVVLTNATVATVGLGLTIPLAFLADWVMGKAHVISRLSLIGAGLVTAGFVIVSVGQDGGHDEEADEVTCGNALEVADINKVGQLV
jgi:solute carrier family 35, member F5